MASKSRSQTPLILILPIFVSFLLFSHCQQVRSVSLVSPGRISSHPHVESSGSGGEMKTFNLTMGDEIDRIELNILSTEKEYRFQMDDSVRFCRKFRPTSSDLNSNVNATCSAKLSFSLLKMSCRKDGVNALKIQRVSTVKSGKEFHSEPKYLQATGLCKNFTYKYFEADVDKHYIGYFEAEEEIIVTPIGQWSENATRASILVSVHYEIKNGDCPEYEYFDCNEKCKKDSRHCPDWSNRNQNWTSGEGEILKPLDHTFQNKSVCIPSAWLCDKLPNCGIYEDADESQGLCYWGENGEENSNNSVLKKFQNFAVLMLDVIFMGIVPLGIFALVVRAVHKKLSERPGPDLETNSNNSASSNVHLAGQNENAQRPPVFTRQNMRRKSDEPPTYDEVVLRQQNQNQTTAPANRDHSEESSTL